MDNTKNLLIATILSTVVIVAWSFFFPQKEKITNKNQAENAITNTNVVSNTKTTNGVDVQIRKPQVDYSKNQTVSIANENISLSINTIGLKINNIGLKNLIDVQPLINNNVFAHTGFVTKSAQIPSNETIWKIISHSKNSAVLQVDLDGVVSTATFMLDEKSMVTIQISINNNTKNDILIAQYVRVNQTLAEVPPSNAISHEGLIAYTDARLHEKEYKDVEDEKFTFTSSDEKKSWAGISEKYTMITFILDGNQTVSFNHAKSLESDSQIFQVNSLSRDIVLHGGDQYQNTSLLFIGKKELRVLEDYSKDFAIPHFDQAIDFGFLYFITKPLFISLSFINENVKNFAISIIILTIIIKLILMPFTIKSSVSMAKMKNLQPEIKSIQERYKNNKTLLGQETIKLYRERKVNPLSGCLPVLLQLPIFFALYKVLYVATEMKNAPLFFWIKDLSSPDPSSIINLYGLLPFSATPFVGFLPIVFGISMFLYQSVSPQPADPTQAKIMKFLPVIMTVFMSGFAAGLLFYWIVSNILSTIQQFMIEKFILPKHRNQKR